MSAVDTIQAKYDELTEVVKKQSEFVTQVAASLKQLRSERKRAIAQINETSGALQAYGSALGLLKANEPTVTPDAPVTETVVTPVVEEPKVLEGEVVN